MFREIADDDTDQNFEISGLKFEPNGVINIKSSDGWFSMKLISSKGPLVSDFVTHSKEFTYSSFGIHIGQDDRLTFMGDNGKLIHGFFVDCRKDSPTLHQLIIISFSPSMFRKLVIPRGVAHTFDNLEEIVTRDEPVWHVDDNNPDWNIDNDLVSIQRDTPISDFPVVRTNQYRLPDNAHQFMSRLSQHLLQNPKSYLARHKLKIGGEDQYVMFESLAWSKDDEMLESNLKNYNKLLPGVSLIRSRYAYTGKKSWTLVPSTSSIVSDILLLPASKAENKHIRFVHSRTRKYYTFLNSEGSSLTIKLIDFRNNSAGFLKSEEVLLVCDPRLTLVIDNGIAYSIEIEKDVLIRCEHEVFVDENEPRTDIPMFGNDLITIDSQNIGSGIRTPEIQCPYSIVYAMAQQEVHGFFV